MNIAWHSRSATIVIVCAMLVLSISMGVRATTGLFLPPMTAAHGWSRESFALAFAIQNLVWGFANPFFGAIADRLGTARAVAGGALFYVAGLVLMRFSETILGLNAASGLLIGMGLAGTTFGVVLGAVVRAVPRERQSAALGLAAAGGSMGQFIMLPIGQQLIGSFEWYGALIALALIVVTIVPLSAALAGRAALSTSNQSVAEALREVGRHRSFHYLFWSYFTCGFHTAFILLHFPAYIMDMGMPLDVGVKAIALIGLFNVIGTYASGVLGGRYSKKNLLAYIYLGRAFIILALLIAPKTPWSIYLFAAAMGLSWLGTVPLTNGLVAQIYGMKYVSMLAGIVFLGHQLGSSLGAWLGGYLYDRSGSYDWVWFLSIGLGVTAALLSWPVDERPIRRAPQIAAAV